MGGCVGPATLQHVQKPREIGADIGMGMFKAVTNAGLGSQMDHSAWGCLRKHASHSGRVS